MRTILLAASAVGLLTSAALADPVRLNDTRLAQTTAGGDFAVFDDLIQTVTAVQTAVATANAAAAIVAGANAGDAVAAATAVASNEIDLEGFEID